MFNDGVVFSTTDAIKPLRIDIILASSKGIDAFALNIGRDTWEPDQVANAYAAAKSLGSPLKLFFSFDMSSLPCSSRENAGILQMYIRKYANHPNQMLYNGSVLVSTFAGEQCTFGSSSLNDGWRDTLKVGLPPVYFVPSLFVDPNTFSELTVMDGAFSVSSIFSTFQSLFKHESVLTIPRLSFVL